MGVDQSVSAIGAVDVPICACLSCSCNHLPQVGGP
jgi:hypothetical protein